MTTSRTINIGELALQVRSSDLASVSFDTAIASDFEVEVEYGYKQASVEDDQLAEVKVTAITASANVHFSGDVTDVIVRRNADLLPLFSHAAVSAIEDNILLTIEADE